MSPCAVYKSCWGFRPTPKLEKMFIVIEGADRTGKSTLRGGLAKYYRERGYEVTELNFPDRTTPTGHLLDSLLKREDRTEEKEEIAFGHLLFSANRWERAGVIRKKLESGVVVICDRYKLSGHIYTQARLRRIGANATWHGFLQADDDLPVPDITFLLEREDPLSGFGSERFETADLQRIIRRLFTTTEADVTKLSTDNKTEQEVLSDAISVLRSISGEKMLDDDDKNLNPRLRQRRKTYRDLRTFDLEEVEEEEEEERTVLSDDDEITTPEKDKP